MSFVGGLAIADGVLHRIVCFNFFWIPGYPYSCYGDSPSYVIAACNQAMALQEVVHAATAEEVSQGQ